MGLCKLCGRPMPIGQAAHRSCMEQAARNLMEDFCGNKCRYPLSCDEETLAEHCSTCRLSRMALLCKEALA